jgi:hypothetical protein
MWPRNGLRDTIAQNVERRVIGGVECILSMRCDVLMGVNQHLSGNLEKCIF